jgi:Na+-transporting NADH:ubiquinone oxidoreductase subunit B
MKILRKLFDTVRPHFEKDGRLHGLYFLFEGVESFTFTTGKVTPGAPHVRDHLDIKRLMSMVIIALIPAILVGIYNTGLQGLLADGLAVTFWGAVFRGLRVVLPIIIVSYAVGGFWEVLFAVIRKHEINEGFLVTGMLFPLVLPPNTPLWQVALGISFGVVIGKEVFGGTGMNIFNPTLVGRAFLFFSYPSGFSGSAPYMAARSLDAVTSATPLAVAAATPAGESVTASLLNFPLNYDLNTFFLGLHPGCIGETSILAILLGALFLLLTRTANWRSMAGTVIGAFITVSLFNLIAGPSSNPLMHLPFHYHILMGGFMFGTVFMVTDPVSAAMTRTGMWFYGLLIGVMAILIRVVNPAYPEGMMLAILFGNLFAPLFDYYVVKANMKRRLNRAQQ